MFFSYKVLTFYLWIYSSRKQIVCFSEVSLLHKSHLMLVTVPCHRLVIWGTRHGDDVLLVVLQESMEELSSDWSELLWWERCHWWVWPADGHWGAMGTVSMHMQSPGYPLARQSAVSKPFWAAVAELGVGGVLRAGDSSVVSPWERVLRRLHGRAWGARQTEFTHWILSGIIFSHLEIWNNITAESFI